VKIPTQKLHERQIRLSRLEMARRHALTAERRRIRKQKKTKSIKLRSIEVNPPKYLKFHGSQSEREAFEGFTNQVTQATKKGLTVIINLNKIERLYPCGLLLFMGQVKIWNDRHPGKVHATYPENEVVEQMLQSVGIIEKLGLKNRVTKISHNDVTRWRYFTGTEAAAQEMEPMMDEIRNLIGADSQSRLYDAIAEAITNVRQHAYSEGESKKWWIFSTISKSSIVVAIYDSGASIPGTLLRKPGVKEHVTQMITGRKKRDASILRMAAGGRSRTKLPYRGKGLPEMFESTRLMPGSSLGIYSRGGYFAYNDKNEAKKEVCTHLDVPVLGTLVLWRIKLAEAAV
jgi:hypothetical protein